MVRGITSLSLASSFWPSPARTPESTFQVTQSGLGFPEAMTKMICIWLLGYYTMIGTDSIRASWGKIYRRHFLGQKESINFFSGFFR